MRRRPPPFPMAPIPQGGASGSQYRRVHSLGQIAPMGTPQPAEGRPGPLPPTAAAPNTNYQPDRWIGWSEIPAFYTVTVFLGGDDNAIAADSTPLRPEPFVLKRITWATNGDALPNIGSPILFNSVQARQVEITWEDEFTKFFGQQPALLAAAFGDSNGFLDMPAPILFQGRQSLQVNLRRLTWPFPPDTVPPIETRFDFQFQGIALLPPHVGSSGSGSVG